MQGAHFNLQLAATCCGLALGRIGWRTSLLGRCGLVLYLVSATFLRHYSVGGQLLTINTQTAALCSINMACLYCIVCLF